MFGYVDLHIWISVGFPKPGTRTQQSLGQEPPSGRTHLSTLASVIYTTRLPLPCASRQLLRWSADTSDRRNGLLQGSFFSSYGIPPRGAEARASKRHSKTPRVTPPPLFPSQQAVLRCAGPGALLLLGRLFKESEHGCGISLAEAAGGRACNLQYVRLHTRCGEGRTGGAVWCGATSPCFF